MKCLADSLVQRRPLFEQESQSQADPGVGDRLGFYTFRVPARIDQLNDLIREGNQRGTPNRIALLEGSDEDRWEVSAPACHSDAASIMRIAENWRL